ncbi:sigma(X)-activator ComW [Falseniella ignava]
MLLQDIYEQNQDFCEVIEQEYSELFTSKMEWESFHLSYLLYYLVRYNVRDMKGFIRYHYQTAYRLYLKKLISGKSFISC